MRKKQTVIVKKSAAKTRKAAEKLAKKHADRIYTSRETKNNFRFRQRPPGCFIQSTFKNFPVPPDGDVTITYGTLKKGAEKKKACR
jgi:hypothetical protein